MTTTGPKTALAITAASIAASLVLGAWRLAHVVPEASLDALAASVREAWQEGDVIVVVPGSQVGPRERLGDLRILEPRTLRPDDLAGAARVHLVELDVIGQSGDARAALLAGERQVVVDAEHTWPGVHYTLASIREPERERFDLHDDVGRLRVEAHYGDGPPVPCDRFERDRLVCPRNPGWSYVGRQILDIDGEARECVWMHPLERGQLLRVRLPDDLVAGTGTSRLLGGLGFSSHAGRSARAPVRLRVLSGSSALWSTTHAVGPAWERFDVPLSPGTGDLAIEVESDDNGAAHLCVALRLLEAP